MRAFVALEIDDRGVLDSLVAMQGELETTGADLKAVERENIHFTVKFLGEISEAQAKRAEAGLKDLTMKGGTVEVRGVGAFPSPRHPSVVWAGVAPEHEGIVVPIAQSVLGALRNLGEEDRRPYRPHATLARVRSPRNVEALSELIETNSTTTFGTTRIKTLTLKSSVLTSRGPIYSNLGEYPLA